MLSTLLSASLFSSVAFSVTVTPRLSPECSDVHIFLAKGNNEQEPGRQGKLVEAVCNKVAGSCSSESIHFNNPVNSPYCSAVEEGDDNGARQIAAYAAQCPQSKLVISGYSQGANVVMDMLGGGGGPLGDCTEKTIVPMPHDSTPACSIVAVTVFGDIRHTASQPYNLLDGADRDGAWPRPQAQLDAINAFGSRVRSYCAAADPVCALGATVEDHLNYFDLYTEDAATWIAEKVATGKTCSASIQPPSGGVSKPEQTPYPSTGHNTTSFYPVPAAYETTTIVKPVTTEYTTICPVTTTFVSDGVTSETSYMTTSVVKSVYQNRNSTETVHSVPATPTASLDVQPTADKSSLSYATTDVPSYLTSLASAESTYVPTTVYPTDYSKQATGTAPPSAMMNSSGPAYTSAPSTYTGSGKAVAVSSPLIAVCALVGLGFTLIL